MGVFQLFPGLAALLGAPVEHQARAFRRAVAKALAVALQLTMVPAQEAHLPRLGQEIQPPMAICCLFRWLEGRAVVAFRGEVHIQPHLEGPGAELSFWHHRLA